MSFRLNRPTLDKLIAKATDVTSSNVGNKKYKKYGIVVFNNNGIAGAPYMVAAYKRFPRKVTLINSYGKIAKTEAPKFETANVRYATPAEVRAFFAIADVLPLRWSDTTLGFIKEMKRKS